MTSERLYILGDTFELREELKRMGCRWDEGAQAWYALDEGVRAMGQGMADGEPWRKWRGFCDGLTWAQGSYKASTFEGALNACSRGIPLEEAMRELRARLVSTGAREPLGWIERDVTRAFAKAEPPRVKRPTNHTNGTNGGMGNRRAVSDEGEEMVAREKPAFDHSKLVAFAGGWREVVDAVWLSDRSAVAPGSVDADGFLRALYEPGERVVVLDVFASQGQWVWSHAAGFEASSVDFPEWERVDRTHAAAPPLRPGKVFAATGPQGIWYLCNPVDGAFRPMGERDKWDRVKWSRRAEASVTDWRYFVFESDEADARSWVAAIVQLPLAIAAIYTSGGKSVHVLVRVDASSKAQFDLWRETAKGVMIPLGADKGCMSAIRLTRLPGCVRELDKDGQPFRGGPRAQKLLFLDPKPSSVPLVKRSALRDTLRAFQGAVEALIAGVESDEGGPLDGEALWRALGAYRGNARARGMMEAVRGFLDGRAEG